MHEMQAPALSYKTFTQMNKLWLQYIAMVLQIRKDDITKGINV